MIGRRIAAAALGLALVGPAAASAQDAAHKHPRGINARQHRQTERIRDGVEDRQLTRGEIDRLKADEAAVRAEERLYRNSGGGLSPRERRDLERDLNKTSREIYRAKHNSREPGNQP